MHVIRIDVVLGLRFVVALIISIAGLFSICTPPKR
jgi:hypothetical protein